LLEVLGVFALAVILIVNVVLKYESELIISTIIIFGVSAIKVLPSLSRILSSVQFLNHYFPVVKTTVQELNSIELHDLKKKYQIIQEKSDDKFEFQKYIEIKDLSFSFGSKKILRDIITDIK
jgi:hypothetical protein